MNAGNGPVPLRLYVGSGSAVLSSVVIDLPDPKIAGSFPELRPDIEATLKVRYNQRDAPIESSNPFNREKWSTCDFSKQCKYVIR